MIDFASFPPDPARAAALDQHARDALGVSLAELFEVLEGDLAWDPAEQTALLDALSRHPVAPGLFATYAALVDATVAENFRHAQTLLDTLLRAELRRAPVARVTTLASDHLGQGLPAIYRQVIAKDPERRLSLEAVDAAHMARCGQVLAATRTLMQAAFPTLAAEIDVLAHETVLMNGVECSECATGFYLWGAIALLPRQTDTRTELAEALARNAAHAYLSGATRGASLVHSDPSALVASARPAHQPPMDELVKGGFALARVLLCQDALLASGLLDPIETEAVHAASAQNRAGFVSRQDVIAQHARFTETGSALWESALAWMAARGG